MTLTQDRRFACLCCGYRTLDEQPPGTFHICPVCFWEDDEVQARDPELRGGANRVSLREARENFRATGASDEEHRSHVRKPNPDEEPG